MIAKAPRDREREILITQFHFLLWFVKLAAGSCHYRMSHLRWTTSGMGRDHYIVDNSHPSAAICNQVKTPWSLFGVIPYTTNTCTYNHASRRIGVILSRMNKYSAMSARPMAVYVQNRHPTKHNLLLLLRRIPCSSVLLFA